MLFTSLSADEFQLNSKSAYIPVTSLHDVMHSYALLDYIISLVNEMKFIHLYLFNYVNIDGN